MKKSLMLLGGLIILMTTNAVAVSGNLTGSDNYTDSFNVTPKNVVDRVSVNQFGYEVQSVNASYADNETQSRTFEVEIQGNASELLDVPSQLTLFEGESSGFPVIANVPRTQKFGWYNGTLKLTGKGNTNFSESVNLSIKVFDDIKPEIKKVDIGNVQALTDLQVGVEVEDNLNVSTVEGSFLRQQKETSGNETVLVNETVSESGFPLSKGGGGTYSYTFTETQKIGKYFFKLNVTDTSGNSVQRVESFNVTGLDSIKVTQTNPIFSTIRTNEQTSEKFLQNQIESKEFQVKLEKIGYGGKEEIRIGVKKPGGGSPEILELNETITFDEKGSYKIVLIHSGDNESKGTFPVNGEIFIQKPRQHVKPRNLTISFSGTVKNVDKPPEICTRVKEFQSCIAYSFSSAKKMFKENYGDLENPNKSRVFMISSIPTSEVEGSKKFSQTTSLTLGEYNETLQRSLKLEESRDSWRSNAKFYEAVILWTFAAIPVIGGGLMFWWIRIGQYISLARNRERMIKKADIKNPGEGLK